MRWGYAALVGLFLMALIIRPGHQAREAAFSRFAAHAQPALPVSPLAPLVGLFSAIIQPMPELPALPAVPELPGQPVHAVHPVTDNMIVNADFTLVNCAYWSSQPGCQHLGTDYALTDGQPVYAPVGGHLLTIGAYPEGDAYGRSGAYLMYTTDDGYELYAGHLKGIPGYQTGQRINAGDILGYGRGDLAHTHIQLRTPDGVLTDFEAYYREKTP